MALSFVQEPVDDASKVPAITNWNPVVGYMLYETTIAGLYYYKLVLEVYSEDSIDQDMLVAKIRQRRNGFKDDNNGATQRARAFFDLRSVINSLLVDTVNDQNDSSPPYKSIHLVGHNQATLPFSKNGDNTKFYGDNTTSKTQILAVKVRGYQHYSETVSASPIDITTDAVTSTKFYMAASLPLEIARSTDVTPTAYVQGTAFQTYTYNSPFASKRFLSDVIESAGSVVSGTQLRNHIQEDDYHTIAFLNGYDNFNSNINKIEIKFYSITGASLNSGTITNTSANGGAVPDTGASLTNAQKLLYFGVGAGNLDTQTRNTDLQPSEAGNTNWAYYTVQGLNTAGTGKSGTYYFIKQDGSCKGFKVRRLAWRNSLGGYDYFNFKMKSSQNVKVNRNTYSTLLGNYNDELYTYENWGRGKNTRQTTAVLEETLNTDWITEQDAVLLENLIKSTRVEMIENSDTTYTVGVMVTDSSFVRKTQANDGMRIQYTIKIEYANPLNTNS